jgi:tRNA pseudouridine55 synthase
MSRKIRNQIDGILLLDKPLGISSNQAINKVKYLLNATKVGHTGTLDPMATGLLPVCLGEATKFASYLLDGDKEYYATMQLGIVTNTGDAEGEIIARNSVNVSLELIQLALGKFIGEINQIPPMYSALKHNGQPLYE